MGSYQKYLTNLFKCLRDIKTLKVINVYQLSIIYLIEEKSYGQKVRYQSYVNICGGSDIRHVIIIVKGTSLDC